MENQYLLSLCIPTNGIADWVFPVLDSIYAQNVDEKLFEVVVADNGTDSDFKRMMEDYAKKHENLVYVKTDAVLFHNQLEALKAASGEYLQFLNHRFALIDGGLNYLLSFVKNNRDTKPVVYFTDGHLEGAGGVQEFDSFDSFVKCLGSLVSWTSGVGIWKEKFDRIPKSTKVDNISPHSHILFSDRTNQRYIVDDTVYAVEIDLNQSRKGKYDFFKAFAADEPAIALQLYADGSISADTMKEVRLGYKNYIIECYFLFFIRKVPCSYDLSGFNDNMGIVFSKQEILFGVFLTVIERASRKILRILTKPFKTLFHVS